jgi:ribosomal protein L11 methyltransferase
MDYYEVSIGAPGESRDAIINRVMEMGSCGTFERAGDIVAYFEDRGQIVQIVDELRYFREVLRSSGLNADFSFDCTSLPGRDWNENWQKDFAPIEIGANLTIVPSWLERTSDRIPLIIDPGMVFGTGYHETTRTCLSLIEKYSGQTSMKSFLDVGTGTGVLAIAASRLGFLNVLAVDTDAMAVDAATKNAELNGLDNISFLEGDIAVAQGLFDLIAANLLSEILIRIAAGLALRLNPGGIAVLSGILPGQDVEVMMALTREGLALREKVDTGNWVTLVVSRRNGARSNSHPPSRE